MTPEEGKQVVPGAAGLYFSTWEVETGGFKIYSHPWLHWELRVSLDYVRHCLKS